MNTNNYNYNNISIKNNNDNITKKVESFYDMNTKDYYNNYNKGTSINHNYSTSSHNNVLNNNTQDNILFINNKNQSLSIQTNIYDNNLLNNQNDLSNLNYIYPTHTNEIIQKTNQVSLTPYNYERNPIIKNNENTILTIPSNNINKENENKIIEATNKIPIIRFYVFIKKLKAKCVLRFLYQISYILNLLDLNKRRNFINSIPFKLPKIVERIFLINFPIKVIESILSNYRNYRIPTTQEIIAPFLELIANLSLIPVSTNQLPSSVNGNNNRSFDSLNKSERGSSSMSPLLLPQSELPCRNSPENTYIIQTPTTFLNNNENSQRNLDTKQKFDNSNYNNDDINRRNNIDYIDNIINNNSLENHDTYHLSKHHKDIPSNKQQLKDAIMNIPTTELKPKNKNENKETPYNFLENNMMLQSNLTLFPLSPYITLNNTDFDTEIKSESTNTKSDNSKANSEKTLSISTSPNFETIQNVPVSAVPPSATTTLSTVAASIAALKSSSSSDKQIGSSLSKIEKKNLSIIKNSNIVKNIVKNFEEINNYYKNALLEAEEKTNNTKSAKRTYKKYGSNDSNDSNDNNDDNEIENNDNASILEEEKQMEEPEDEIENVEDEEVIEEMIEEEDEEENIILTEQDRMRINEACDKVISESKFMQEADMVDIKESTNLMNSYIYDFNTNGNDGITEIIKDFSLENNFSDSNEDSESNSEVSNNIFSSIVNIEDLDITRLTILLIESFVKLTDSEKEEFLSSEYFDLIKNHVMNIQNDEELELNSIFKDPKMLNEFESHIEALQQCVKERDDIINYYYQEIVNERIQNEKLLVFCENEQLEREETNKIITGLTKKIEMEEDYIKKLEVRCDMLIEKIKKYQSCCKHYEKSISLLSGNKPNALKLLNTQNFESAALLNNPPSFVPTAASVAAAAAASPIDPNGRPGIAHLINKLSCEKISKNEEVQYLKSLLKSYNGKHIYINENVIKKQIIEKTMASSSQSIPATIDGVPVISVNPGKDLPGKKMMMEKYFNDEKQLSKMEETIVVSDEEEERTPENEDDEILQNRKSIDLSIIDDLNIFNEKHYEEKVLHKHQRSVEREFSDDNFSEYAPTLVN